MKHILFLFSLVFLLTINKSNAQLVPENPLPTVSLTWDASVSPDITNYWVYYGDLSGYYTNKVSVGTNLIYSVIGFPLVRGAAYYYTVTAQSSSGLESEFSNEYAIFVPGLPASPRNLRPFIINPLAQEINGKANPEQVYLVEKTEDFLEWVTVGETITDKKGDFSIIDPTINLENPSFYRISTLTSMN